MIVGANVKPVVPAVPAGAYFGVCVYDLFVGEQETKFEGKTSYRNQFMLGFEIMGQTREVDGKTVPAVLGRTFTVSARANSNFRKFIEGWLGKKFSDDEFMSLDTRQLLGRPAYLNVILNETGEYANIESAGQIPTGVPQPVAAGKMYHFDINDGFDEATFATLEEWMQEKIKKSTEYQKEHAPVQTVAVQPPITAQAVPAAIPGIPQYAPQNPMHGNPPAYYVQAPQGTGAAQGYEAVPDVPKGAIPF